MEKDQGARGLQRNNSEPKRAIIGDPRNDENVIVSQLQASMLRFHNKMATMLLGEHPRIKFEKIQQMVRWHYQWVILQDFLPTIVGQDMVNSILPHLVTGNSIYKDKPLLKIYSFSNHPFIPVEFSVAAYRFGHSMVRPVYRLNQTLADRQTIFLADPRKAKPGDIDKSLNGFRDFPDTWAIDWDLFFNPGGAPLTGKNRIQKAYKIDTSLVNPLGELAKEHEATGMTSLAERNLRRGLEFGLPSGQAVARYIGEAIIPDDLLKVGKANEDGELSKDPKIANKSLTAVSDEFANNAPLWYYVLAEAQQQFKDNNTPIKLGPVGGRIVAETFIGLMLGDSFSFLVQHPDWTPLPALMKDNKFLIKDLLHFIL